MLTQCFFFMMACLSTAEPKQQYYVAWLSVAAVIFLVVACVGYLANDPISRLLKWARTRLAIRRRRLRIELVNRENALRDQGVNEVRELAQ